MKDGDPGRKTINKQYQRDGLANIPIGRFDGSKGYIGDWLTDTTGNLARVAMGAALAAIGLGRAHRIIEIHRDGTRLPLPRLWGERPAAQRHARILAGGDSEGDVTEYAVSDGRGIVFRAACPEVRP